MSENITIQMENTIVKTTEEIIMEMEKLPPEERRVIIQHFETEEKFSEEDDALIREALEDSKQGKNMEGPFTGKEAINHLRRLRGAPTI